MNLWGEISCDFLNSLHKKIYLCRGITKTNRTDDEENDDF